MNNDWKDYLLQNGAAQDNGQLFVFNEAAGDIQQAEDNDIICDVSHFSTIVFAGEDAAEFMQGQFTNDIKMVDENTSQISAICSNKGRMISNFRVFQHQQNHFICTRSDMVEHSINHLQKYVLRAQVMMQDVSDQLVHTGISGNNAEALLSPFISDLSTEVNSVSHNESYIAIRVPAQIPRYEIFCSFEHARTLWESVSNKANVVNSAYWDYLNIKNGLPFIDSHTSEAFVPQMTNIDLIGGISFDKGCYTGQEIVARTHYLGKQKRRTYHIRINTPTIPVAGQQLGSETATENQYTGTLVNVVPVAENTYEALAVIQIKSAELEKLTLKDADAEISLLQLPYSLEESTKK